MSPSSFDEKTLIHLLSLASLSPERAGEGLETVSQLSEDQRAELVSLANSNHVIIRALRPLSAAAIKSGNQELGSWGLQQIRREQLRIENALPHLAMVCKQLEADGCPYTVIKSLDHDPDLGNDLDLYTTAPENHVVQVLTKRFGARIEPRSWGDRLAQKWNFAIPDLPEAIEIHVQRLGQTGEHTRMAQRFVTRRQKISRGGHEFFVPAPEERIIVATLQRMYRHFYFRVCDIANTAALVDSGVVDFTELKRAANIGSIWKGVCSYLKIVSDYIERYRGTGIALPKEVLQTAPFGGEKVFVRERFLRVPIMPEGAGLYTAQVTGAALQGDVPATLRLSLLPYLASAAAISYKITGSDKGIW